MASSLLLLLCCAALAQTPRELIEQGNAHFAADRYAEALETYAQIAEPDELLAAELLHNRAAAHFKLGRRDDARELWVRAAGLKDELFEAAARYNLGNCDYADALEAFEKQNAGAALELLDRAAEQYRDALRLDPTLLDARANLELAAQLRKQIEALAQQQPQTQPSPQQDDQQQGQQDQSTSQPSSQPSESEQGEQDQDSERQQDQQPEEGSEQQQDSAQQPSTQPEPSEDQEQLSQQQQPLVPIEMTREEAERLLQMIRDAERQRRAALRARQAAGYKEVDKDW